MLSGRRITKIARSTNSKKDIRVACCIAVQFVKTRKLLTTSDFCVKCSQGISGTQSCVNPNVESSRTSLALASKLQVLKNCPVLGSRTALLFVPLKSCWKIPEISRKICEDLFFVFLNWRSLEKFLLLLLLMGSDASDSVTFR